jgi:putative aminopeptidase FrvX
MPVLDATSRTFLKALIETASPSGFETHVQECIRKRMRTATPDVETDVHGNVVGRLNRGAPLRVMLAGHCDEIGFMVTYISEDGFLYVQPVGGIDLSLMPGRRVLVHTARKKVPGVFGKKPIHLLRPEERRKVPLAHDLWVDIGATGGKDALKRVQVGDIVTVADGLDLLENHIAVGRAFDDKIGAFIVTETLCRLRRVKDLQVEVAAVSTVQEEIGLRGARTSAFEIRPHVGVAVDVGFASDHPGGEKKIVGDIRLGKGPILHKGAAINPVVGQMLSETARKKKIPFQMAAEPRASSTDADVIQISRAGVAAGLLGIPNRYMHTPVEMISLKDAENAIRLLAQFVRALKPGMDFTPRPL